MTSRAKRLTVLLVAVTMVVGLVASVAWAKATKTPVYGEIYAVNTLDMGVWTFVDEGLKIRGMVAQELLDGDLAGYIMVYADGDYTSPGNGEIRGDIQWFPEGCTSPTFVGKFDGVWADGAFDGYWLLHGVGEFEGQTMHIHNYGTMPQPCEGHILDPHGE